MNNEFKSKDMELYETWKANPTKGNMGALMSQLHPLLQREVSSLAGSVPAEALMAEAKKHTVHAIKTYDASKGTQYNPEFTKFDSNHIAWEYVKSHLTAEESRLFDTIMLAEHGPKKMSAGDIATSLGVNLNRYNYLRGNLVKKIASLQSEIGEF